MSPKIANGKMSDVCNRKIADDIGFSAVGRQRPARLTGFVSSAVAVPAAIQ
jgi:hypothetical protein